MTLGNFEIDARACLAVVDFERHVIASFSGSAGMRFGLEDPLHPTGGTRRYWDLAVQEWIQFELGTTVDWELIDASPFNPIVVK